MESRAGVLAGLLLSMILSGCIAPWSAEEHAESARRKLLDDIGPGGDISGFLGHASVRDHTISFELTFAPNGSLVARTASEDAVSVRATYYCQENGPHIVQDGGTILAAHGRLCPLFHELGASPFDVLREGNLSSASSTGKTVQSAWLGQDGRVSVRLVSDRDDLTTKVYVSGMGGSVAAVPERKARSMYVAPDPHRLISYYVVGHAQFLDGVYYWVADGVEPGVRDDDLEIRVFRGAEVVAAIPLSSPGTNNGFEMRYWSEPDGYLAVGDQIAIRSATWQAPDDFTLGIIDKGTGRGTGAYRPTPFGLMSVLAGVVLAVIAFRPRGPR